MHLYTKISKRDSKKVKMTFNILRIIALRWSWNSHHGTRPVERPSTRQRQSTLPPLPSVLTGNEPTGSDSEASEEMDSEKCVAKKSIDVCVKLKEMVR